jgi:hypothetical protein
MFTPRGFAQRLSVLAIAGAVPFATVTARALDKQGSAHGGDVSGADSGFGLTGAGMLGAALYNPTYAARPDNTGLALFRYAAHADIDLIGRRLSIPLDINFFTDRERPGALKLVPSELDLIAGLTSTWGLGPGALELGVRVESDRNLDRGSYSQSYVDARARYLFSLADEIPELGPALDGNITGHGTVGVFMVNPTYAARPDNSGLALLRYALHGEVSFLGSHAAVGVDATMFTDRQHNPVTPSELDLTPELIGRLEPFEAHLAYERDMPIAEPAAEAATHSPHVQHFVYMLLSWSFDAFPRDEPKAAPPANPTVAPPQAPGTVAPATKKL